MNPGYIWSWPNNIYCISDRTDSTPPASSKHLPTLPLPPPALSDSQVVELYCRQSRERLGGQLFGKCRGGAVPSITDIYSLGASQHCLILFLYFTLLGLQGPVWEFGKRWKKMYGTENMDSVYGFASWLLISNVKRHYGRLFRTDVL